MFSALIWRPLRNDLGRTLLSLLAIALGVAVVIAIRVANRSAIASFQQTTQALAGNADLLVAGPQPLPETLLTRLIPLTDEAEFSPYLDRRAYDPKADDTVEILGLDLLSAAAAPRAAAPQTACEDCILIPGALAATDHLRAGDELGLVIEGLDHRFRVGAVLPAGPASAADAAYLDLPAALQAFEPGGEATAMFDGLRVRLAPGADGNALIRALRPLVPAADSIAPPRARDLQDAKMLAAFRANLEALSYVSLLVGIFLIYNTVSISVVRRRTAIAIARALGATRGQVLRLFLAEGAALSLAGGALGLGLGWMLADGALALVARTINSLYAATHPTAVVLTWGDALWALSLAAGAGVVAAWAPARDAAQVLPAQALRPGSAEAGARDQVAAYWWAAAGLAAATVALARLPEPGNLPLFGFLSALTAVLAVACCALPLLAGVLPRLRLRLLARGRLSAGLAAGALAGAVRRSAILTVALATAIGVMLGVAIMVGSFRQTVQIWIGQQLQADVFLRAADWDRDRPAPLAPELVAAAAATPGLAGLEASHTQPWEFRGEPVFVNTRWWVRGSAPSGSALQFLAGGPGAVAVSEPFARRFHLGVGDALGLDVPSGRVTLPIRGVFYDYSSDRGLIDLDAATFTRGFGRPQATELGFFARPGVSTAELHRRLDLAMRPFDAELAINDNAALRREAMRVFDQTFRITYALEAITLLVAILGVGNTLLAVVLERVREFAVLRFLGATRAQIRRLLLAESSLIAMLALGLGWLMGAILAVILVRVINVQSFGWTIQFHLPVMFLLPASGLVGAAILAAAWLPVRAAQQAVTAESAAQALGAE